MHFLFGITAPNYMLVVKQIKPVGTEGGPFFHSCMPKTKLLHLAACSILLFFFSPKGCFHTVSYLAKYVKVSFQGENVQFATVSEKKTRLP